MTSKNKRVSCEFVGGALVLECLLRKLEDEETLEAWEAEIYRQIEHFKGKVILSFKNVFILTSSALRHLILIRQKLVDQKIPFGLCGLSEDNRSVLEMTCLDRVFVIGDEPSQVASLLDPPHTDLFTAE